MWKPYLNVIAAMLPAALNVLDRFHIAKKLGEAVDEVRREEVKQLLSGRTSGSTSLPWSIKPQALRNSFPNSSHYPLHP
jgi:transposase